MTDLTELTGPSRERLKALLKEYNEYPERQQEIDARIHDEFCKAVAIVVIDSCGFSRAGPAARDRELPGAPGTPGAGGGRRSSRPTAGASCGWRPTTSSRCSRTPSRPSAAAAEVQRNVEIANEPLPAASEIYIAIGVGYGRILLVGEDDAYGDEMNVACKLGEDVAEQGEILLTAAAHEAIGSSEDWQFEDSSVRISGLDLTSYKLVR